jgi:hypothetical protein
MTSCQHAQWKGRNNSMKIRHKTSQKYIYIFLNPAQDRVPILHQNILLYMPKRMLNKCAYHLQDRIFQDSKGKNKNHLIFHPLAKIHNSMDLGRGEVYKKKLSEI